MPNLKIGSWCWWGFLMELLNKDARLRCMHMVALSIDFSPFEMLVFLRGLMWEGGLDRVIYLLEFLWKDLKRSAIWTFGQDVTTWHHGCLINTGLELIVFSKNRRRENGILSCKWRMGLARSPMKTDFPLIFQRVCHLQNNPYKSCRGLISI